MFPRGSVTMAPIRKGKRAFKRAISEETGVVKHIGKGRRALREIGEVL